MLRVLKDFNNLRSDGSLLDLERLFLLFILFLRVVSVSYWLRGFLPSARDARRPVRDRAVDIYCVVQTAILLALLAMSPYRLWVVWIASYILFEIILVLANIIFVGKFRKLQARPASIERSILLLLLNLVQAVIVFAIYYRHASKLTVCDAFFQSCLVLGTVGYPEGLSGPARLLVSLQIFVNLAVTLLLLGSFAGQIGLFRSQDGADSKNDK
jgi:hypothetical protein